MELSVRLDKGIPSFIGETVKSRRIYHQFRHLYPMANEFSVCRMPFDVPVIDVNRVAEQDNGALYFNFYSYNIR